MTKYYSITLSPSDHELSACEISEDYACHLLRSKCFLSEDQITDAVSSSNIVYLPGTSNCSYVMTVVFSDVCDHSYFNMFVPYCRKLADSLHFCSIEAYKYKYGENY
ncbi:hypothetical protein [Dipodfec virus UA23Rod_1125]|uniref:Uncharacterized protein n=1 Tax=Dipodfec virus UA23Rod_1125 TaxID=2929328 RepID=A0A976R7L9_9VIRU|nr:hypothetical protein [Dipodfec virus UA23Rod_1125]